MASVNPRRYRRVSPLHHRPRRRLAQGLPHPLFNSCRRRTRFVALHPIHRGRAPLIITFENCSCQTPLVLLLLFDPRVV